MGRRLPSATLPKGSTTRCREGCGSRWGGRVSFKAVVGFARRVSWDASLSGQGESNVLGAGRGGTPPPRWRVGGVRGRVDASGPYHLHLHYNRG